MGAFDTLVASCPDCREEIEIQYKGFDSSLKMIKPGDKMPEEFMGDGAWLDEPYPYCPCKSEKKLVILVIHNRFFGFTRAGEGKKGPSEETRNEMDSVKKEALQNTLKLFNKKIKEGLDPLDAFYKTMMSFEDILVKKIKKRSKKLAKKTRQS